LLAGLLLLLLDGVGHRELWPRVRGMVFVTLAMDSQLAGLAGKVPDYLSPCVVEAEQSAPARRLSGAPVRRGDRTMAARWRAAKSAGVAGFRRTV
jgi:hypothetical protein